MKVSKYFRGDAAFSIPELYELVEAEGYGYAIRLKGNAVLMQCIQHLLTRPVGRPPKKPVVLYHRVEQPVKTDLEPDQATGCSTAAGGDRMIRQARPEQRSQAGGPGGHRGRIR